MSKTYSDTCPCGQFTYTITYDSEPEVKSQSERFCYFCGISIETNPYDELDDDQTELDFGDSK